MCPERTRKSSRLFTSLSEEAAAAARILLSLSLDAEPHSCAASQLTSLLPPPPSVDGRTAAAMAAGGCASLAAAQEGSPGASAATAATWMLAAIGSSRTRPLAAEAHEERAVARLSPPRSSSNAHCCGSSSTAAVLSLLFSSSRGHHHLRLDVQKQQQLRPSSDSRGDCVSTTFFSFFSFLLHLLSLQRAVPLVSFALASRLYDLCCCRPPARPIPCRTTASRASSAQLRCSAAAPTAKATANTPALVLQQQQHQQHIFRSRRRPTAAAVLLLLGCYGGMLLPPCGVIAACGVARGLASAAATARGTAAATNSRPRVFSSGNVLLTTAATSSLHSSPASPTEGHPTDIFRWSPSCPAALAYPSQQTAVTSSLPYCPAHHHSSFAPFLLPRPPPRSVATAATDGKTLPAATTPAASLIDAAGPVVFNAGLPLCSVAPPLSLASTRTTGAVVAAATTQRLFSTAACLAFPTSAVHVSAGAASGSTRAAAGKRLAFAVSSLSTARATRATRGQQKRLLIASTRSSSKARAAPAAPVPLGLPPHYPPSNNPFFTGISAASTPLFFSPAALLRAPEEAGGDSGRRRAGATAAVPPTTAATTGNSQPGLFSFAAPSSSLSWLLSTLLASLAGGRAPQYTQREEKNSVASSTGAAAAAVRGVYYSSTGVSSLASLPPPATHTPLPGETGQRSSRSVAAAAASSRVGAAARTAFSLPLCAGCSSLVPSFIMAAAAAGSEGSAVATAVETPEKHQQEQQQHVVLRPRKHPVEKVRLNYKPPDFLIDHVDLIFDLHEEKTKVTSKLTLRRRPETEPADLVLDGEELTLLRVQLGEEELTDATGERGSSKATGAAAGEKQEQQHKRQLVDSRRVFALDVDGRLVIAKDLLPLEADKHFHLITEVYIHPSANLQLMGLYKSGRLLVTQCEAEGFRRITYFLDRPDVMSLYKVKLIADRETNPTLLSNGNKIEEGDVEGQPGKHFAVYEDPFRKPCYLFALVAGDLASISDTFTTSGGREVSVRIFSEPEDSDKLTWALESLLKAMKWDETRFGLQYDLDIFNVVCAKDFNMGAMENKSLNIFNAALLLAHPKTSTDTNFQRITNVIGHEYFHNWTGNRVTCRDWFQLTLKEGLTVFRDQQFTADMFSAAVKRIEDVAYLRQVQFVEDSGPMAHPIRPETYVAVDNFYTATVYSKGAEVIRMYHTLLGERGFRKGMDLYFQRHDGQAVTCDDFRNAMADANKRDLKQFELWYLQAGTPELEVLEATFLGDKEEAFKLTVKQTTAPTPKQPHKQPFHIPIKFGLIGKHSKKDLLEPPTQVLELTSEQQTFVVSGVKEDCVLSLLRDFSAPVKVKNPLQTDEDIAFLMGYDSDDFSKWQAAHTLTSKIVGERAVQKRDQTIADFAPLPEIYVEAFRATLLEQGRDKSVQAYTLRLPGLDDLAEQMDPIDPEALYVAAQSVRREIGKLLRKELLQLYEELSPPASETVETRDQNAVARRRLRNEVLYFLTGEKDEAAAKLAMEHFTSAKGMTDRFAALAILVDIQRPEKEEALDIFYKEAEGNPLVLDKWFALQAMSECPDTTDVVRRLQKHPDFTMRNPNRLRALMFTFSRGTQFHNTDGKGYHLMADCVLEVDKFNHQIAAHGAGAFLQWRKFDEKRQKLMLDELHRIRATPGLSPDTMEIVEKALADDPALVRRSSPGKSEGLQAVSKEQEKSNG